MCIQKKIQITAQEETENKKALFQVLKNSERFNKQLSDVVYICLRPFLIEFDRTYVSLRTHKALVPIKILAYVQGE